MDHGKAVPDYIARDILETWKESLRLSEMRPVFGAMNKCACNASALCMRVDSTTVIVIDPGRSHHDPGAMLPIQHAWASA